MSLLDFFRKNKKADNESPQDQTKSTEHVKNAVSFENKVGDRFLKIKDSDCGLILHDDGTLDIVFTKFKNESQSITEHEESLMALAVFIKQPGFLPMILEEFRRIASLSSQKLD